jgi:hypothetical protein
MTAVSWPGSCLRGSVAIPTHVSVCRTDMERGVALKHQVADARQGALGS